MEEKVSLFRGDIGKNIQKTVLREGAHRTRILYAGVNPEDHNSVLLNRVVELMSGFYFFEKTIINPQEKSIHTTLSSLKHEKFHTIINYKDLMHQIQFHPNPEIVAATSYDRQIGKKVFHNTIFFDLRNKVSMTSFPYNLYVQWKIRNYLNKRNTLF